MKHLHLYIVAIFVATLFSAQCHADEFLLTEKRQYTVQNFSTTTGAVIPSLTLGYETYGQLNQAKDNAILITHYFSGNSHAAGKYRREDSKSGYWDSLIGPGKPLDTNRFFIVAADTPINLGAYDPHVITTGPASTNPATGKLWGLTFPVLQVADFVNAQKALLDQLEIDSLVAIAGASGGAIQAMQWAADYPHIAGKYLLVIGPGAHLQAQAIAELGSWTQPILADKNWNRGNYSEQAEPLHGLVLSLRNIIYAASGNQWLEQHFGRQPESANSSPSQSVLNDYLVNQELMALARDRAQLIDANHLLYMARAYQQFDVRDRVPAMRGEFLFVASKGDRIFPPELSHDTATLLVKSGQKATVVEIDGGKGHLDGIVHIDQAENHIRAFIGSSH